MNETYTIIDNFDKLDLSFITAANIATSPVAGLKEYYMPDQVLLELENFIWHTQQNANETIFSDTSYEPLYNVPYNFSHDFKYIPDMFRYITSRKFYIDFKDWTIKYPTEQWRMTPNFPAVMSALNVLGQNCFYDLLQAEKNFTYNGVVFGNSLSFGRYYAPGPMAKSEGGIPIEMVPNFLGSNTTATDVRKKLNEWYEQPMYFFLHAADKTYNRYLLFDYDQHPKKPKNGSAFDLIHAPMMYDPQPDVGTILDVLNSQEGKQIILDYLQKLLLFEKWKIDPGDMIWKQYCRHLYMATDLPKGTGIVPPEYEYIKNSNVVQFNSVYNYYSEIAEDAMDIPKSHIQDEKQLPNLYTYYSLLKKKSQYYEDLVKLDTEETIDIDKFTVKRYYQISKDSRYDRFPLTPTGKAVPTGVNMGVVLRNRTIIVENKEFLNQANAIAELFPMYNKISLPSKKSGFMELLESHKLSDEFITLLGNYFSTVGNKENYVHRFAVHNGESGDKVALSPSYLQIMKVQDLFENFVYEKYFYDNLSVKIGFKEPIMPKVPVGNNMLDNKSMAFYQIKKEAKKYFNLRRLMTSQIYKGKKCHTEVLAFEIAKYKSRADGTREHIQSIFLPSLGVDEEISYLDTQVAYGKDYTYEIFTHSLLIGSEYYFSRDTSTLNKDKGVKTYLTTEGDFDDDSVFDLLLPPVKEIPNEAVPLIVRAPYYNTRTLLPYGTSAVKTKILDKPPLPPQIVFHPYKDDENKLLVLLNHNFGDRWMKPVYVFDGDEENFAQQYEAQKHLETPVKDYIHFQTDDIRGQYEIYRTTRKPTNWKSFSDAEQTTLDRTAQSGYEDLISPNVDYYYFARCMDVHGNLSNPTSIFHIRIVKEGGFPPYLISKVYNFSEAAPPIIYDKKVKKYLKISLAPNTRKITNEGDIVKALLAYKKNNNGQLKKYKIRLTSTQTGKKMDINIDFANIINNDYFTIPPDKPTPNEVTLKEIKQMEKNATKEGKLASEDIIIDSEPVGGLDGYGKPTKGFLE